MFFCEQIGLQAQSKAPTKLKTEQEGLRRRKSSERGRKRKNKGTVKRRNKALQRAYYKKKSNQTQYPGNIWIDPRPKDFTAIKERVERNPSRKNLKTQKLRESFFRASSSQKHKSFGSEMIRRRNSKLSYQYSSKAIISSKGNMNIKPPKRNFRKASRKIQRHTGNIFLQPEAKKRDYNEIRERVDKNPGRTMAKRLNRQKNKAISNAALTQTYRGDINVKAKRSKRKTYQYDSRTIQKFSGSLRAQGIKSSAGQRKYSSATTARFKGDLILPARNHKRLRYEYMSKVSQRNKGDMKRPPKALGPQYTARYSGDLKSNDKRGKKQWAKYEARKQTQYSGDLSARKYRTKVKGNPQLTQHIGGIKVYSKSKQEQYMKRDSRITGSYSGNIRGKSRKSRYQELQGKSYNYTLFEGGLRRGRSNRNRTGAKLGATYAGNIKAKSRKSRYQELQGKSMNFTGYEGNIRVLSKRKQDRYMLKDSKITGNYSGNLARVTAKQRRQALEGKSMNLSEYRGEIRVRDRGRSGARQPKTNWNTAAYQGDIIISARNRKKLEYEYLSRVQHNYPGDIRLKKYSKWLDGRKYRSGEQTNFQGNLKTTRSDLKEKQYEHMSKTAHNYSGSLRQRRPFARDRYYRNISDRNQQIIGNFRVKTRLAKDIEEQIASAKVHNYQGGPKTSLFTRIWLSLFDNSGKLDKLDDKTRKPKYDSREYKIWY